MENGLIRMLYGCSQKFGDTVQEKDVWFAVLLCTSLLFLAVLPSCFCFYSGYSIQICIPFHPWLLILCLALFSSWFFSPVHACPLYVCPFISPWLRLPSPGTLHTTPSSLLPPCSVSSRAPSRSFPTPLKPLILS